MWTDFGQGWLLRSETLQSIKHTGLGIKGLALILGSSTNYGPLGKPCHFSGPQSPHAPKQRD